MQATETARTSSASTNQAGGKSHHEAKFTKLFDGRKRAIRGLWRCNERFYAQLTVFDPISGKNRVQWISLLDKQGEPVASLARAVAVMEGLRTKRCDTGLDAQVRRAPKFTDRNLLLRAARTQRCAGAEAQLERQGVVSHPHLGARGSVHESATVSLEESEMNEEMPSSAKDEDLWSIYSPPVSQARQNRK
jgi:hypothetical protein